MVIYGGGGRKEDLVMASTDNKENRTHVYGASQGREQRRKSAADEGL